MKTLTWSSSLVALGLIMGSSPYLAQAQEIPDPEPEPDSAHCVFQAVPEEQAATETEQPVCFGSFAEAVAFATEGAVQLPDTATPEESSEQLLGREFGVQQPRYIIGIEYDWPFYRGASAIVRSNYSCYRANLALPSLPPAWNNRISSARSGTAAGCNRAIHYDLPYFGGSLIACTPNCASMGAMDNRTSSIRWRR